MHRSDIWPDLIPMHHHFWPTLTLCIFKHFMVPFMVSYVGIFMQFVILTIVLLSIFSVGNKGNPTHTAYSVSRPPGFQIFIYKLSKHTRNLVPIFFHHCSPIIAYAEASQHRYTLCYQAAFQAGGDGMLNGTTTTTTTILIYTLCCATCPEEQM